MLKDLARPYCKFCKAKIEICVFVSNILNTPYFFTKFTKTAPEAKMLEKLHPKDKKMYVSLVAAFVKWFLEKERRKNSLALGAMKRIETWHLKRVWTRNIIYLGKPFKTFRLHWTDLRGIHSQTKNKQSKCFILSTIFDTSKNLTINALIKPRNDISNIKFCWLTFI